MTFVLPTKNPINLLLIADRVLFRESISHLLSTEPDFKIAAQCSSAAEALPILKQQPVDVVLLEFSLGEQQAFEFIHVSRTQGFRGRVLLLTAQADREDAADLIRAGVCGIFLKRDSAASLGHAIRDVAAGNLWLSQEQLQLALDREAGLLPKSLENGLTRREREVLSLVSTGLKNREIGVQIGVSEGSVKATLQQLFSKFGVRSRSRLVRVVLEGQKQF